MWDDDYEDNGVESDHWDHDRAPYDEDEVYGGGLDRQSHDWSCHHDEEDQDRDDLDSIMDGSNAEEAETDGEDDPYGGIDVNEDWDGDDLGITDPEEFLEYFGPEDFIERYGIDEYMYNFSDGTMAALPLYLHKYVKDGKYEGPRFPKAENIIGKTPEEEAKVLKDAEKAAKEAEEKKKREKLAAQIDDEWFYFTQDDNVETRKKKEEILMQEMAGPGVPKAVATSDSMAQMVAKNIVESPAGNDIDLEIETIKEPTRSLLSEYWHRALNALKGKKDK